MISNARPAHVASLLVSLFLVLSLHAESPAAPPPTVEASRGMGAATVGGIVSDDSGARIPGVTVTAMRAGETEGASVAVTSMDGGFKIEGLRPGAYSVEANLDGFKPAGRELKLGTGQAVNVAFKLVPSDFSEVVQVVAEAVRTGEVAILESRRQAAVVSDSISAEEIRRTPDSSAASVVERLTGVTLIGDKYVFVRGLGERYSGTTINGATLPTTESEKRVVPLDLFPARLLETVNVVKTYTPDKPGDFGSGVVEMTTVEFPTGQALKLSIGASHHDGATGKSFRRYAGGLDWQGRGGQAMPSGIPTSILRRRNILDPEGFTQEELQTIGRSIAGAWAGDESAAPAGTDFSLTYGNTFGRFGLVLSAVSNHGYSVVDEVQRFYGVDAGELIPINDYDLTVDRESTSTGYVGNFSVRVNDSNRIFLNGVLTRDASAEDRFQQGLQTGTGGNIRDYRVRYQIEEISSARLRGEHNLAGPGIGSLFDWSIARSSASNDSDLRENVYRESSPGVYFIETGYADTGKVEYFGLEDEIEQGGLAYSTFFSSRSGAWSGTVKGGYDRLKRTRDFGARRFRFVPGSAVNIDPTDLPDEIFTPENIAPNRFEIREITGVNDAYDAGHTIDSGYVMADVTRNKWRAIVGARYEMSDQSVTTFNPFDVKNPVFAINESNDILPSLNLVYQVKPQTNIRFGYGRSLNRPEFRELSPFVFTEVAGGRSVAGNPDLEQATLDSFDIRWETFPSSGQVIAASTFYKKIDQPIEKIVQPTSDLRQSFVNADSAQLWGVELEFRRSLDITPLLRYWSVNLNYAYINSDVTVGEQQLSVVTSTDRPLEGQSDQVGNIGLQFFKPEWGTMVRFLGSFTGERLAEVGAYGLPDIYEAANTSLDFVVSQSLGTFVPGLEVKLGATNVLNGNREFVQGDAIQRAFEPGRKISLSLSYSPF